MVFTMTKKIETFSVSISQADQVEAKAIYLSENTSGFTNDSEKGIALDVQRKAKLTPAETKERNDECNGMGV